MYTTPKRNSYYYNNCEDSQDGLAREQVKMLSAIERVYQEALKARDETIVKLLGVISDTADEV